MTAHQDDDVLVIAVITTACLFTTLYKFKNLLIYEKVTALVK